MRINRHIVFLGLFLAALPLNAQADQDGFLYAYGLDESRYGDIVVSVDAYKPLGSPHASIRPFADVFVSNDSKTAGGTIPRIYGDNYAGAAIGLQYRNTSGLRIYVQGGATTRIGAAAAVPSGGDVRGGAQLYREWGGLAHAQRAYGNFYGSGTYYSRYQDTVFYNQLESGRLLGNQTRSVDLYLRGTYTVDTHQYFYDNLAELTAGVRLHPFGTHGPSFAIEGVGGIYTHPGLLPLGTRRTYWDFRPTIAYGVNI